MAKEALVLNQAQSKNLLHVSIHYYVQNPWFSIPNILMFLSCNPASVHSRNEGRIRLQIFPWGCRSCYMIMVAPMHSCEKSTTGTIVDRLNFPGNNPSRTVASRPSRHSNDSYIHQKLWVREICRISKIPEYSTVYIALNVCQRQHVLVLLSRYLDFLRFCNSQHDYEDDYPATLPACLERLATDNSSLCVIAAIVYAHT
jgi:hypothetical protein